MSYLQRYLYAISLYSRSLLFSIVMIITTILQFGLCVLGSPFPLRVRYFLIATYNRIILWELRIICGIKWEIKGLENIPPAGNGIILSKHQSTWETLMIPTLFYQPAIIIKKELLWVPFFGWGLATIDPIAINRSEKSSAMEQIIKKGQKCLANGRWILIFPEGTRIPFGKVGKYHLGGARLAIATERGIIPIAHNAGLFWPKRQLLKRPGTVQMVIGKMIETKDRKPEEITEEVKQWIEKTIIEINSE